MLFSSKNISLLKPAASFIYQYLLGTKRKQVTQITQATKQPSPKACAGNGARNAIAASLFVPVA